MKEKKRNIFKQKAFCFSSIFSIVFVVIAFIVIKSDTIFVKEKSLDVRADDFAIEKICELATLKCYYHDVAEYEDQPDGLFKYGLFQYGYKKFWIEYDGVVKVGIDFNEVVVKDPDENGIVAIYVPNARILGVDSDISSMSDPVADKGVLTKISTEEKTMAFSAAQISMRENAEKNSNILNQAKENAKELIKQYVINIGEQTGYSYTVEWIEELQLI